MHPVPGHNITRLLPPPHASPGRFASGQRAPQFPRLRMSLASALHNSHSHQPRNANTWFQPGAGPLTQNNSPFLRHRKNLTTLNAVLWDNGSKFPSQQVNLAAQYHILRRVPRGPKQMGNLTASPNFPLHFKQKNIYHTFIVAWGFFKNFKSSACNWTTDFRGPYLDNKCFLVISILIDSDRGHCYEHFKKINLQWNLSPWHLFECLWVRWIFELPEIAKN